MRLLFVFCIIHEIFQQWKLKYIITRSTFIAKQNWKGTRDKRLNRSKDWEWWQALALRLSSITYCVCGYHVYRHIWDAALCETLVCGRKPTKEKYRYTFAVINFNVQPRNSFSNDNFWIYSTSNLMTCCHGKIVLVQIR